MSYVLWNDNKEDLLKYVIACIIIIILCAICSLSMMRQTYDIKNNNIEINDNYNDFNDFNDDDDE